MGFQSNPNNITAEEIEDWLVEYIARLLQVDPDTIDPQKPFKDFGLDSMTVLGMLGDLSDFLGCEELEPSILYKQVTIEKLSQTLAG